jgi:hypothetical protein
VNVGVEVEVTVTEIETVDVHGEHELKDELLVDVAIYKVVKDRITLLWGGRYTGSR